MFFPTHMELFLKKSKTDQYREGRWVLIFRVGGQYCLVALVELLLKVGRYAKLGPGSLIRNTTVTPKKQNICSEVPSNNTVLGWYKDAARALGLDPDAYRTRRGAGAQRARSTWTCPTGCSRNTAPGKASGPRTDTSSALYRHVSRSLLAWVSRMTSLAELVEFECAARF
jgi:hypothetical protein